MFLLDTNVISELRKIKNGKANKGVETWFFATPLDQLFLNDIVLLEIKQGALLARYKNDFIKADILDDWISVQLPKQFNGRILWRVELLYLQLKMRKIAVFSRKKLQTI